jgi:hypothetical protein
MKNVMLGALPTSGSVLSRYAAAAQTAVETANSGESLYSPAPPQDYSPAPVYSDVENKPEESPVETSSPVNLDKVKSDVIVDTDQNTSGDSTDTSDGSTDSGTGTKISPILLVGGALAIYFLFFRKKS